jgi:biotin synthase-related radical SAM superfamily protein
VRARNDARFDKTLRELGLKRDKGLVTNQLMTAMETICDSDCLMVATQKGLVDEREMHRIVTNHFLRICHMRRALVWFFCDIRGQLVHLSIYGWQKKCSN